MTYTIPARLAATCARTPERAAWLATLPGALDDLQERWSLTLGEPLDGDEVSASWVAPTKTGDGAAAVLKLGMPHFEGEREIDALRFWDGDPTVRLLAADETVNAMLLERCEPGTHLRERLLPEQDVVVARILRRLWQTPPAPHRFRPLAEMTALWSQETLDDAARWPDPGLVRAGLELFAELPRTAPEAVLLATDLHAGNILAARREPWLAIDPKPFVGDPAYDTTQHLLNDTDRLLADLDPTVARFAGLTGVDRERARLWLFARAAAESRNQWGDDGFPPWPLARALAPA